jgi:hypothetical protein
MMTRTRKTKKTTEQARTAKLMTVGTSTVLAISTPKDTTFYRLEVLAADRGRGFRLSKADKGDGEEPAVYDVNLDGQFSSCECLGFLHHNHCRHIESLTALLRAGKLPQTETKLADATVPVSQPEEEETVEIGAEPPAPANPRDGHCPDCGWSWRDHISGYCPL